MSNVTKQDIDDFNTLLDGIGPRLGTIIRQAVLEALYDHSAATETFGDYTVGVTDIGSCTVAELVTGSNGILSTEVPGEREVWAQAYAVSYAKMDGGFVVGHVVQISSEAADLAVKAFRERYK